MSWKAITEEELRDHIEDCCDDLTQQQLRFWEAIKIPFSKWVQEPWGNEGNGFWVVAIIGSSVIWFNDIEYGFNISKYTEYGKIDVYSCDQGELDAPIIDLMDQLFSNN